MPKLVLCRHGESIWNLQNRFTGWVDVPLSPKGINEAKKAGEALKGMNFAVAYTSALSRAQNTLALIMESMGVQLPVIRDQALNERHYGALQGLNKESARQKFGEAVVHLWRRSFDVPPPDGESLKGTARRTLPFFESAILGDIAEGSDVLVVAHGNSNRSIIMSLEKLSAEQIVDVELPTGTPIVYELGKDGTVISKNMLSIG